MEAAELCQDRFLGLSDLAFLVNMLLVDFWPYMSSPPHLLLLQKSLQTFESLTALILFCFFNSAQQRWTATHQHIPPQLQWRMMKEDEHSLPDRRQHTVYGINFQVNFIRDVVYSYVQLSFELSNADSSWLGSNIIHLDSTNQRFHVNSN